jgi:hypothetical protein
MYANQPVKNVLWFWMLTCSLFVSCGTAYDDFEAVTQSAILRPSYAPTATLNLTPTSPAILIDNDSSLVEKQLIDDGYWLEDSQNIVLDNVTYRASLYRHSDRYSFSDRLLVHREEGQQAIVFYDLHNDLSKITTGISSSGFGEQIGINFDHPSKGWYDMNGDGLLELTVFISNGGIKCALCNQLQVIQLCPDEGITNLTLSVPPEDTLDSFAVVQIVDLNDDGIMEWEVVDDRYGWLDYNAPRRTYRIYAWDGETYRNASDQFSDRYQIQIDELTARLMEFGFVKSLTNIPSDELYVEELYIGELITLLVAHDNIGQREEGWKIFETYANPDRYEYNSPHWFYMWERLLTEYEPVD